MSLYALYLVGKHVIFHLFMNYRKKKGLMKIHDMRFSLLVDFEIYFIRQKVIYNNVLKLIYRFVFDFQIRNFLSIAYDVYCVFTIFVMDIWVQLGLNVRKYIKYNSLPLINWENNTHFKIFHTRPCTYVDFLRMHVPIINDSWHTSIMIEYV